MEHAAPRRGCANTLWTGRHGLTLSPQGSQESQNPHFSRKLRARNGAPEAHSQFLILLSARRESFMLRWLLGVLLCLTSVVWGQGAREKVIIDTDIGDDVDDAFALALAVKSPELEVLGVTTT